MRNSRTVEPRGSSKPGTERGFVALSAAMSALDLVPDEGLPLGIEVVDGAVTNCPEIIAYLDTLPWTPSPVGKSAQVSSIRTSSSTFVPILSFRNPEVIHQFARTVWSHLVAYATTYGFTIEQIETISFNKYEPGQNFDPHTDYFPGSQRVASAVVYLNTIDVGGETHFTHFDRSIQAREGRILLFPSNFLFHHSGRPPVSGTKYSAAFWARG